MRHCGHNAQLTCHQKPDVKLTIYLWETNEELVAQQGADSACLFLLLLNLTDAALLGLLGRLEPRALQAYQPRLSWAVLQTGQKLQRAL